MIEREKHKRKIKLEWQTVREKRERERDNDIITLERAKEDIKNLKRERRERE